MGGDEPVLLYQEPEPLPETVEEPIEIDDSSVDEEIICEFETQATQNSHVLKGIEKNDNEDEMREININWEEPLDIAWHGCEEWDENGTLKVSPVNIMDEIKAWREEKEKGKEEHAEENKYENVQVNTIYKFTCQMNFPHFSY